MNTKRRIRCPICKKYGFPTKDHVPPKSCNNKDAVIKTGIFPTSNGYERREIVQGGLSFCFICENCNNNILGAQCDNELASFYDAVLSENGDNICWNGDIKKIIKSVFGHLLATGEYSPCVYDDEMRKFINKDKLPSVSRLYVRSNSVKVLDNKSMVSCLYFYPLAFIVAEKGFDDVAIDLTKLYADGKNQIIINKKSFTNVLTGRHFPPCWPCAIGNSHTDDTVDAILSGKEGSTSSISVKK